MRRLHTKYVVSPTRATRATTTAITGVNLVLVLCACSTLVADGNGGADAGAEIRMVTDEGGVERA